MSDRVLILYASKSNATADYAGFIAGELIARGIQTDQINLKCNRYYDLTGYSLVILGTGIRMGRWYGPAKKVLKNKEIDNMNLAVFVSCGLAIAPDKRGDAIASYITNVLKKYDREAISKAAFSGKMPGSKTDLVIDTKLVKNWVEGILNKVNLR